MDQTPPDPGPGIGEIKRWGWRVYLTPFALMVVPIALLLWWGDHRARVYWGRILTAALVLYLLAAVVAIATGRVGR